MTLIYIFVWINTNPHMNLQSNNSSRKISNLICKFMPFWIINTMDLPLFCIKAYKYISWQRICRWFNLICKAIFRPLRRASELATRLYTEDIDRALANNRNLRIRILFLYSCIFRVSIDIVQVKMIRR